MAARIVTWFTIKCEGQKASQLIKRSGLCLGQNFDLQDPLDTLDEDYPCIDRCFDDDVDNLLPIEEHSFFNRAVCIIEFDHNPTTDEVISEFVRLDLRRPSHEEALVASNEPLPELFEKIGSVIFFHEPVEVYCGFSMDGVLERLGEILDFTCLPIGAPNEADTKIWQSKYFAGVRDV